MDWIRVDLTQRQWEIIHQVGTARHHSKRDLASTRAWSSDGHVAGYAAECALRSWLGVTWDTAIMRRGNGQVSCTLAGARFNVKHNAMLVGDLRYNVDGVPPVDYLVLALGALPPVYLAGWVTRAEFLEEHTVAELTGRGTRWLFEQGLLHPMATLPEILGVTLVPLPDLGNAASAGRATPTRAQARARVVAATGQLAVKLDL